MMQYIRRLWFALLVVGIGTVLFVTLYDYLSGNPSDGFGTIQKVGVFIGFALILIAGNHFLRYLLHAFFMVLFILGFLLLSLNVYGAFVSIRSPKIYEGSDAYGQHRVPDPYLGNGRDQLAMTQRETYQEYAYRLTDRVHDLTIHLWDYSIDYREYNHQVPLHENYLLWLRSYIEPDHYLYYEFCDPYKAIERGVVICSQAAKAIVNLWQSQTRLQSRNVVLNGHVVAEVQMEAKSDIWWVLDADFGIVMEYDIATLESQPELIVEHYGAAGYDPELVEDIAGIYGKDGNYVETNKGICEREERLYRQKWSIPLMLLGSSILYFGSAWMINKRFRLSKH